MAVRINIDDAGIMSRIDNAWTRGVAMLCSQILRDCNYYCKEDTGMLIASSMIHSDLPHGKLVWQTPYAARQYYEIETANHDTNPNATSHWCEVAKTKHYDEWARQAQRITELYG